MGKEAYWIAKGCLVQESHINGARSCENWAIKWELGAPELPQTSRPYGEYWEAQHIWRGIEIVRERTESAHP